MRCQRQILDVCWWAHVSNAEVLQRYSLSTIGGNYILRHRRLSLFGHVARLDPVVPAYDAMLCVWRWIPAKAERQWPAGEDHRVALATSSSTGFRRIPTLYCTYLRCGDLRSPGATEQRTFTRTTRRRRWWWRMTCGQMEGKTIFSRHLQAVRYRDVECLKIIDVGYNLK